MDSSLINLNSTSNFSDINISESSFLFNYIQY